jgi:hypothetical protein
MQFFKNELKSTRASHKKLKGRLRALQRYIILHYVLLALSLVQNGLALFVVINYPGPYKEALVLFLVLSLAAGAYVLFSGFSK